MEFVTLNTSLREQNHHRFKNADDVPQKNIKLTALSQRENKLKLRYSLAKFLLKYSTPSARVLSNDMAL
ncbi:MAG: hypothetical protein P4L45_10010 [Ignavibacteriaceae bacterium]|nr:hypothetical protein [Ignavibacteriaceae bacterium]